jgi:hypothetical protein
MVSVHESAGHRKIPPAPRSSTLTSSSIMTSPSSTPPPRARPFGGLGQFGWQCAVHHRDIARLIRYELAAAHFGEPGDWHRARRMLRAGVRFSMVDEIVFDYYPRVLWRGR